MQRLRHISPVVALVRPTLLIGMVLSGLPVWGGEDSALLQSGSLSLEDRYVTLYGAQIHYVEHGSGPVVVLVHGLADDLKTWSASIEPLGRHYRVIAPDLIGHGRSAKPLLNYRPATFAD